MIRSKQYGTTTIEATFAWDFGDPPANVAPGWGEDTGVIITTPIGGNRLDTYVTFAIDCDDPAQWEIETIVTTYGRHTITQGGDVIAQRKATSSGPLQLHELPEVLEVVSDAYTAWKAIERLSEAQDSVNELHAYIAELGESERDARQAYNPGLSNTQRLELVQAGEELKRAEVELAAAKTEVRQRGVA